jgi:hypothetical protein
VTLRDSRGETSLVLEVGEGELLGLMDQTVEFEEEGFGVDVGDTAVNSNPNGVDWGIIGQNCH